MSAQRKGVDHLLRQYDEDGFFRKVFLVSPYMRRDERRTLDARHELIEFGIGVVGRWRRLFAPLHLARIVVQSVRLVRREGVVLIRGTEPTLCGALAWTVSRLTGVPYCISLHADYDKLRVLDPRRGAPTLFGSRRLATRLERMTLRGAARVLPIRDSLVRYAESRGVRRDRIRVFPHGLDMTAFDEAPCVDIRAVLGLPLHVAIIAFVGRLSPENYVDDMLAAARRLASSRRDFVLVLAGGGVLKEAVAARLRNDPGLAQVVRTTGFISAPQVRALRSQAAVSLCLMGGFSLIEACAAGRPVVAYDVEWHRELVINGRTGWLIPEHDTEAVANAIATLLDDHATASRLGEEARSLAYARHSLSQVQPIRRAAYAEIMIHPSPPGAGC
jgi:glycosyltransferase involved in cell wall biosynthesis